MWKHGSELVWPDLAQVVDGPDCDCLRRTENGQRMDLTLVATLVIPFLFVVPVAAIALLLRKTTVASSRQKSKFATKIE